MEGAKSAHNLDIDLLGSWNERAPDWDWRVKLRRARDSRGHQAVKIVAADTSWSVCDAITQNHTIDDAVAVIQNTVNTLHDLYFRAIGRPPYPRELALMWNEVVHPQPEFPRCPESEVL